jgi:uncharacterized protein (UPF0548 family)
MFPNSFDKGCICLAIHSFAVSETLALNEGRNTAWVGSADGKLIVGSGESSGKTAMLYHRDL